MCFLQFACTDLDDSQKEGDNPEREVPTLEETMLNWGDFFRFSCFVMLVKYWFIALARTVSEIRLFSQSTLVR